jgi:hypothetical protein
MSTSDSAATTTPAKPPAFMRPGIGLMRRISMKAKLLGVASVLVVPLIVAMVSLTQQLVDDIRIAEAELDGVSAIDALTEVVLHIQTHRGLTNRVLSGDEAAKAPRDATRQKLKEALATVDAVSRDKPQLALGKQWPAQRQAIEALTADSNNEPRPKQFAAHSALGQPTDRHGGLRGRDIGPAVRPHASDLFPDGRDSEPHPALGRSHGRAARLGCGLAGAWRCVIG